MAIQKDKVDGQSIVVWGLMLVLVTAITVFVLEGFYYGYVNGKKAEEYSDGSVHASYRVKDKQRERLAGGIKLPSGKTSLPIDDAMRKVVERESK